MSPNIVRVLMGLSILTLLSQCNRAGSGTPDPATLSPDIQEDEEYIGLGSVWHTVMRSDKTFRMTKSEELGEDPVIEIEGTYRSFSSGFYKLLRSAVSGSSRDDAIEEAIAFSVPGAFLITKAFDDNGNVSRETQLQPARTRSCWSNETKYNWMRTGAGKVTNILTKKRWGNLTLPRGGGEVTGYKWDLDGNLTNRERTFFVASRCSNGLWRTKKDTRSGETNYGFVMMTQSGISLMDPKVNDDNDGTQLRKIAIPVDNTVDSTSLSGKSFVGLLFKNINRGIMYAVEITFDDNGVGSYAFLDDVENPRLGSEEGTLTVTSAGTGEQQGFIKLQSAGDFEGTGDMWAMVTNNLRGSRRTFFYATGVLDPTSNRGASILAVQKE